MIRPAIRGPSTGGNAFLRSFTRPGLRSVVPDRLWQKIDNPFTFSLLGPDPKTKPGSPGATSDGYEAEEATEILAERLDETAGRVAGLIAYAAHIPGADAVDPRELRPTIAAMVPPPIASRSFHPASRRTAAGALPPGDRT